MKWVENILQGVVPILIAVCVIAAVVFRVPRFFELFLNKEYEQALLAFLISTLLLGYGFAQLIQTRQIRQRLDNIDAKLREHNTSFGSQLFTNEDDIYGELYERIVTAKRYIRVVLHESRPVAHDGVLKAIADKVRHKVDYKIVVVHNSDNVSGEFRRNHQRLMRILAGSEVTRRYWLYELKVEKPIFFDVIIIDEKDVGVAVRRSPREKEFQCAILFKNNPEMAKSFVEWFEHVVVQQASPIELSATVNSLVA